MRSGDNVSLDSEEICELLVGTWTGIALITEILIQKGAAQRRDIVSLLSDAERVAKDRRRTALTALRKLLNKGVTRQKPSTFTAFRCRS
jgi:hypothetical protein